MEGEGETVEGRGRGAERGRGEERNVRFDFGNHVYVRKVKLFGEGGEE